MAMPHPVEITARQSFGERHPHNFLLWLEKQSDRSSDVVMVTNVSYRELAVARGRAASEDVFIVRNGPDADTFKVVPPNLN
jgi:hypothetical protein